MPDQPSLREGEFTKGNELCGGRFIVECFLKSGGVGAAYLCQDVILDERVVCKLAHEADDLAWNEMRLQFLKLARVASLDVVKPLGFFVHREKSTDRGRPVIELEWVDGVDFGDWVKSADLHERMQALARIATALAGLHREGLAHGDLNPSGNVRVTPTRIVLLDVDSELSGGNPRDFDRASLATEMEALLSDYSKTVLAVVLQRLRESGESKLPMDDVAAQIHAVARNLPLVDLSNPLLAAAATSFKERLEQREARYQFIRRQRILSITSLADRIRALVAPFGLAVEASSPDEADELRSQEKGWFVARTFNVKSPLSVNRRWSVVFDAITGFVKPEPYVPMNGVHIIAHGISTIADDFARRRHEKLQLRLDNDVPQFFILTPKPRPVAPRSLEELDARPQWRILDDSWLLECISALVGTKIER